MNSIASGISGAALPPMGPGRNRTPFIRNGSATSSMTSATTSATSCVPRNRLIKSDTIPQQEQPQQIFQNADEFMAGARRRTGVSGNAASSNGPRRHHTLHYRQGTLVFPSSSPPTTPGTPPSTFMTSSPPTPTTTTTTTTPRRPAATAGAAGFFSRSQSAPILVDDSILRCCQNSDLAALLHYVDHHDKIVTQTWNKTDASGKSGLLVAALTGNSGLVRQLIKQAAVDINLADKEGNSALHLASQAGHADVVSLLILCPSLAIDARNNVGVTALMKAALQGRVRCTRLLLLAGASPVVRDLGRGMCALEWAVYCGRGKCVEIIEKYMDKMQLNPGLAFDPFSTSGSSTGSRTGSSSSGQQRFNSMQSLKRSSLPAAFSSLNLNFNKVKQSWVKSTLKRAMDMVSGGVGGAGRRSSSSDFSVANAVLCASTPVLPGDVPLPAGRQVDVAATPFIVPVIQISPVDAYESGIAGVGDSLPVGRKPSRKRRETSPVLTREEVTRLFKQITTHDNF